MEDNEYVEMLIAKVLAEEASDEEVMELLAWRNASVENEEYFSVLQQIYSTSPNTKVDHVFNSDTAWTLVKQKLESTKIDSQIIPLHRIKNANFFLKIAASLAIIIGLSFSMYKVFFEKKIVPVTVASNSVVKEFKLPDSTIVFLNRNSQIIYSFSDNHRQVKLDGEAFFDLTDDPQRPFEVKAGNLLIQDIGTAFNVKAATGSDSVIVFVESGEVVLTSPSNNYVRLVQGEKAVYLKKRDQFIKEMISDTNTLAYKTRIFVFENASLISAVQKINEVYGINIQLVGDIEACHITATFKNESANTMIEVIAATLNLTIKNENGAVILEGVGCEE
ncbi:MAG: FecR domain-containing protein [Bacteroidetes bacterium]|nr:FecR domain-containing protein [Bacteroidota bacterium]